MQLKRDEKSSPANQDANILISESEDIWNRLSNPKSVENYIMTKLGLILNKSYLSKTKAIQYNVYLIAFVQLNKSYLD